VFVVDALLYLATFLFTNRVARRRPTKTCEGLGDGATRGSLAYLRSCPEWRGHRLQLGAVTK